MSDTTVSGGASAPPELIRESAVDYAQRELLVVPVPPGRKGPTTTNWPALATSDPVTVDTWFSGGQPPNIGLLMGERSSLIALDIDPRHGGERSLKRLVGELGSLPETWQSRTGGNGLHLIFRRPNVELRFTAAPGIDVLGGAGHRLIVAPPSRHASGRLYSWELPPGYTEPAELPAAWIQRLRATPTCTSRTPAIGSDIADAETFAWAIAKLTGQPARVRGHICCPLPGHDDRTPSFYISDRPEPHFFCFGCARGGDLITFGAHYYGIENRGGGFWKIRRRLYRDLGAVIA